MDVVFEFELWRGDVLLDTSSSSDRKQAYDEITSRQWPYLREGNDETQIYEVCRHPVAIITDNYSPCSLAAAPEPPEPTVDPEQYRREPATLDAVPVRGLSFDYSHAGTLIDRAVHHLDEGLPNGQYLRCKFAFAMLKRGTYELEVWMDAKGYFKTTQDRAMTEMIAHAQELGIE